MLLMDALFDDSVDRTLQDDVGNEEKSETF